MRRFHPVAKYCRQTFALHFDSRTACSFALLIVLLLTGCPADPQPVTTTKHKTTQAFGIYWPPRNLASTSRLKSTRPLLDGNLSITNPPEHPNRFGIHISLTRPQDDESRQRWNRTLAFPEYSWMAKVRVWDQDKKWLWPNLPFLLTAHGEEHVTRYGGIDPGKGIDNDFAAIFMRPLGRDSRPLKTPSESDSPSLVSAQWQAADTTAPGDKTSIVHTAHSDDFFIDIGDAGKLKSGKIGIWLIYADFLGSSVPRDWPQGKEYAGGILAYFEIDWTRKTDGTFEFQIEHLTPPSETGFDWESWSTGTSALKKRLLLNYENILNE